MWGMAHPRRTMADGYPRILVLRGGAVGDFVLTLPALAALRDRWPDAYIEVVGYPRIAGLALCNGLANRVTSLDKAEIARLFALHTNLSETQEELVRSFDLILNYLHDPLDTVRRNLEAVGVRQVIVGSPMVAGEHAARFLMRPLESLAIYPEAEPRPRLEPTEDMRAAGRELLAQYGERVALLHPGSGSPSKNWPLERFVDTARRLEQDGLSPVLSLGEADEVIARDLQRQAPAMPRLPCGPLDALAGSLASAALYVGNDSGISHLAGAVGTPVVALFGPTDPDVWGVRGDHVHIVRAPEPTAESLQTVPVDTVHAAIRSLLTNGRE